MSQKTLLDNRTHLNMAYRLIVKRVLFLFWNFRHTFTKYNVSDFVELNFQYINYEQFTETSYFNFTVISVCLKMYNVTVYNLLYWSLSSASILQCSNAFFSIFTFLDIIKIRSKLEHTHLSLFRGKLVNLLLITMVFKVLCHLPL